MGRKSQSESRVFFVLLVGILSVVVRTWAVGSGFGAACTDDERPCDVSQELMCNNGTCGCQYTWQTFDEQRRKCLSPLGGFCQEEGPLKCVSNAECSSKDQFLGFCLCSPPFEAVNASSCKDRNTNSLSPSNSSSVTLICCPAAIQTLKKP